MNDIRANLKLLQEEFYESTRGGDGLARIDEAEIEAIAALFNQRIAELEALLLDAEAGKTEYLAMQDRIAELEANCCRLIDQRDEESDLYEKRIAELEAALNETKHVLPIIKQNQDLKAENQRLREALTDIKTYRVKWHKDGTKGHYCAWRSGIDGVKDIARGALNDDT